MKISTKEYNIRNFQFKIRPAHEEDAKQLSELRERLDGETEYFDREEGEYCLSETDFCEIIKKDTVSPNRLCLVAEIEDEIVGYSRCEGSSLKRFSHKAEFGVGVLKEYWGYSIGKNLLKESLNWADHNGITKISLSVTETNQKAIALYKQHGFEIEGTLKHDRLLGNGKYYATIVMGRFKSLDTTCLL